MRLLSSKTGIHSSISMNAVREAKIVAHEKIQLPRTKVGLMQL